jgi:DNA-binding beta-propeller fold protein YncE
MTALQQRTVAGAAIALAAAAMAQAAVPPSARQTRAQLYVVQSAGDSGTDGPSIAVFDNSHKFVRRIHLERGRDEVVRGITADAAGQRLYLTTTQRLLAFDLPKGRVLWQQRYGGYCCERPAISPDGRAIYVPALGRPLAYIVDAGNGDLTATIDVLGSPRQALLAADGRHAYVSAWESKIVTAADARSHKVVRDIGPFSDFVCPFAINARGTLAFVTVDRLVGFEIADLQTGLTLDRVIVEPAAAEEWARYECPSHGIALSPGERELWVADGVANRLHVFDATTYPPAAAATIQLRAQPRWITFSRDGRFAYAATEVIDTAARKVAAVLEDERGNPVRADVAVTVE